MNFLKALPTPSEQRSDQSFHDFHVLFMCFSCVFHVLFMCFMNEVIFLHTSSCPFWQRGKTHRGQSRSCSSDCTIQIYTDLYILYFCTSLCQFLACRDLAGRFMPNCLRSLCCPLVHSKYTFKRLALRLPKGCP